MCYCPIYGQHCDSGVVKGEVACEFWDEKEGDCRIRRCVELFVKIAQKLLKGV